MDGAYEVECCLRHSDSAFWVPILRAGIYAKDLGTLICQRMECVTADVFIAHPDSCKPYAGRHWVMPGDAVRVWVLPLGTRPPPFGRFGEGTRRPRASTVHVPTSILDAMGYRADGSRKRALTPAGSQSPDVDNQCSDEEASDPDPDDPDMPFHAVRKGHQTGIFLTKSLMQTQVNGFPDAEYKTFATLAEATAYIDDSGRGVSERDLMSQGSRARHPPAKSNAPTLFAEAELDAGPASCADAVPMMDILLDSVLDPVTKVGYCAVALYPSSRLELKQTHVFQLEDGRNAARCELLSSKMAVELCKDTPGVVAGFTNIRLYCSSTYATNAVNDYARATSTFRGHNADAMASLAELLKTYRVRAFWMSSTDATLQVVRNQAIALRLKTMDKAEPARCEDDHDDDEM